MLRLVDMNDLTLKVLEQIRDELRANGRRIDETNGRLDQTNQRLDQTNQRLDRLERRQSETEVRLATELVSVVGAVNALRETLLEDRELRHQVTDHEHRLARLEARAG